MKCLLAGAALAGVALAAVLPVRAQEPPPEHTHEFTAYPVLQGQTGIPRVNRYHALPEEVLSLELWIEPDWDTCLNTDGMCPYAFFPWDLAFLEDFTHLVQLDDTQTAPNKGQFGHLDAGVFVPGPPYSHYMCPTALGQVSILEDVVDEGTLVDGEPLPVDGQIQNTSDPIMVWSIISPAMSDDEKFCMSAGVPSTCNVPVAASIPVYWAAFVGSQLREVWSTLADPVQTKTLTVTTENNRPGDTLNGRLPAYNSSFGAQNVIAIHSSFEGSTCCRRFLLFFPRTGTNCPTEMAYPVPNWYYYWSDTSASYGPNGYKPDAPDPYGWTPIGSDVTWIGPLAHTSLPDYPGYEGIDFYALTCRHEAVHLADWAAWWPGGYNANADQDGDLVPDNLEAGLGYDDSKRDTDGDGQNDFEDHARDHARDTSPPWDAQHGWNIGDANSEDWACPGKQWTNP